MKLRYEDLKKNYKHLLEAFEKSERIRGEQKELIHNLKKDLIRVKASHAPDLANAKRGSIEYQTE